MFDFRTDCQRPASIVCDCCTECYSDRVHLEAIYNATTGEYWTNRTNWTVTTSHCNWFGITCDDHGDVTRIDLRSNNITGTFPSEAISKLHKLKRLDLAENDLSGTLAESFVFRKLLHLIHVDLSQNKLEGNVDAQLAPALESVNFAGNNFTSVSGFTKSGQLRLINLSNNSIQNTISDILANAPSTLQELLLTNNTIAGSFPELDYLGNLQRLRADWNALAGNLPDFSASYPNIEEIDLSHQKGPDNSVLSGTIPATLLSTLPFLSRLSLADNSLTGSIPPVLGDLARLKELDLSNNTLKGSIPPELGQRLGSAAAIVLASNEGL